MLNDADLSVCDNSQRNERMRSSVTIDTPRSSSRRPTHMDAERMFTLTPMQARCGEMSHDNPLNCCVTIQDEFL